jgi:hypothetical protein
MKLESAYKLNSRGEKAVGLSAAALLLWLAPASAAGTSPILKARGRARPSRSSPAWPPWPNNTGTFANPGMGEKDIVIDVTNQVGRRFWGKTTLSGNGEKSDEPFIGELYGPDNRKVIMSHAVGIIEGEIDTATFCRSALRRRTAAAQPKAA